MDPGTAMSSLSQREIHTKLLPCHSHPDTRAKWRGRDEAVAECTQLPVSGRKMIFLKKAQKEFAGEMAQWVKCYCTHVRT